jgi:CBS domain-containing protein
VTSIKRPGDTVEHVERRELRRQPVRAVGRSDAITIEASTPIGAALERLREARVEGLLVCEGDRLVGLLTEREVLERVLGAAADLAAPVAGFMAPEPRSLPPDAPLTDALALFNGSGEALIPLVGADSRVEGVLRQTDVLAFVAEAFPQEILNLPPDPDQVPESREGG